ncbi:tRNA uridine(34) 5-carboxymethylaminomethyl modification radical SAM/GNAT enzyme Elp3 [Candidatus Methanosphaera massiliense]|jgi:elongator complex protein 3|uniref:tRNA uridine(34) 5-carboxymethylaminomethyl modification radical SAM/GNAT enzyme Elp3 n=1 Tax=Methanosphaera TaxID=2316 RepID=UPI00238043A9|nr:tRNA uridine(34) 5-carboxymethylaminomethyl modification radical SAM/GNAT enzyme Elp3 [Candidatus Methanosphaera massiliense]MDD6285114.1 tRNA uridine(34) 5-carboxymethylaminomethyl modification radical SAM/GNAT enzyme Elp3 [Methanobacteriaceae archaeon]MDE4078327.1 tRNA uridine(34) 5-carboxymethylaminomethyl modification radical SAM/GNAT enzyme Elp3 [Candidatus Methanosphaera massiliense]MDY2744321.1 tRNA uridine(34) 5-carboxymethylaminomethyl modification radical SAM/GNAT enzyme Elp3 [Metha
MEDACRLIIEKALENNITTKKELEKLKIQTCRDLKLKGFMSNSKILQYAKPEELETLRPILMKKPTRTISGVAIVAVMCHPHKCPHGRCKYCPESSVAPPSYTGEEPAALRARMFSFHPYVQTFNRLYQLRNIGHPIDKVELIIMGGTFASRPLDYQEWFVTQCLRAMNDFESIINTIPRNQKEADIVPPTDFKYLHDVKKSNEHSKVRCVGLTFETRPDYSKTEDVNRMLGFGVTRVELGVQTLYNYIYKRIDRGHRIQDVVEANQTLRDSGIKVAMHMMPGLYSTPRSDLNMFKRLFTEPSFCPDMLKIYPCLVTEGSEFYEMWKRGEYEPYTSEQAVDLIVEVKKILPKWVRTMRIQRDIPATLIDAGVKKSNLGELVYNRLEEENIQCQCIRCREVGHKRAHGIEPDYDNIELLRTDYDVTGGHEIFLSIEDPGNDIIIGFTRLRIPSKNTFRPEITPNSALIRELHVYGQMQKIGKNKENLWQHKGYGGRLLHEAERIAKEEYEKNKLLIISGIGVRDYYRKLGYHKDGPYMSKFI